MKIEDLKICPYCGQSIRALDNHAIKMEADCDSKDLIKVICQLVRYYRVNPVDQG